MNIFIFHGVEGHSKENWFPWLQKQLEEQGHQVFIPNFPTPENQTLENWLKTFEEYKNHLNENSILVGHSLGVAFLLTLLEKYPVKTAFLIAGFVGKIDHEFDENMKTFAQKDFNWEQINNNCQKFYIYQSGNDPYVKEEKAFELGDKLNTEIMLIKDAGHFNEAAGYGTFETLLEKLNSEF